jgi:hypothetical protein
LPLVLVLAGAGMAVEAGAGIAVEAGAGIGAGGDFIAAVLVAAGAVPLAGMFSSLLWLQAVSAIEEAISSPQSSGRDGWGRSFMAISYGG